MVTIIRTVVKIFVAKMRKEFGNSLERVAVKLETKMNQTFSAIFKGVSKAANTADVSSKNSRKSSEINSLYSELSF